MKKYLSILLRKFGLAGIADRLRFRIERLKQHKENRSFANLHPDFRFPPDYFIYETYLLSYKDYYEDGKATAELIKALASKYIDFDRAKSILDWGCGPGRVIRHFPLLGGSSHQYSGSDYNEKYTGWCAKNIPGISFFVNELSPPLEVKSDSFDLVYGLSIFTHLSEKAHYDWMHEIFRILRPGGIFIFTTHGDGSLEKLTPSELEDYRNGNFVSRSFLKEGHRMYSSFQPEKFMDKIRGKFTLLEFIPGGKSSDIGYQDCRIFRKPFI